MHIYIKNNDHNNEDADDINDKLHLPGTYFVPTIVYIIIYLSLTIILKRDYYILNFTEEKIEAQ